MADQSGNHMTGLTLSVIGCGTMATAILSGVVDACSRDKQAGNMPRFSKFLATVQSEASATRLHQKFGDEVEILKGNNLEAMQRGQVILLGFKPYMVDTVLSDLKMLDALTTKLVISVLVGTPICNIEKALYGSEVTDSLGSIYIKRAMPNLAAEHGQSMTVIESDPTRSDSGMDEVTDWIFLQLGKIQSVPPNLYDVGGVLAGAAGGFLTIALDGMLDGAVSQGLKRAEASNILRQTLVSLASLLEHEHPAVLREKMSSPRGTTIAGLLSLEEDRARWAYCKALNTSADRSKAIGNAAKR